MPLLRFKAKGKKSSPASPAPAERHASVRRDITIWYGAVKPGGILAGHDYGNADVRRAVADRLIAPDGILPDGSWWVRVT